jgi:hypothetical protein
VSKSQATIARSTSHARLQHVPDPSVGAPPKRENDTPRMPSATHIHIETRPSETPRAHRITSEPRIAPPTPNSPVQGECTSSPKSPRGVSADWEKALAREMQRSASRAEHMRRAAQHVALAVASSSILPVAGSGREGAFEMEGSARDGLQTSSTMAARDTAASSDIQPSSLFIARQTVSSEMDEIMRYIERHGLLDAQNASNSNSMTASTPNLAPAIGALRTRSRAETRPSFAILPRPDSGVSTRGRLGDAEDSDAIAGQEDGSAAVVVVWPPTRRQHMASQSTVNLSRMALDDNNTDATAHAFERRARAHSIAGTGAQASVLATATMLAGEGGSSERKRRLNSHHSQRLTSPSRPSSSAEFFDVMLQRARIRQAVQEERQRCASLRRSTRSMVAVDAADQKGADEGEPGSSRLPIQRSRTLLVMTEPALSAREAAVPLPGILHRASMAGTHSVSGMRASEDLHHDHEAVEVVTNEPGQVVVDDTAWKSWVDAHLSHVREQLDAVVPYRHTLSHA